MALSFVSSAVDLRYENYHFEPRFNDVDSSQFTKVLNDTLLPWRKASGVKSISNDIAILVAYKIELKKESFDEWSQYRRKQKNLKLPYEKPEWEAVSLIREAKVIPVLKKYYDLFPVGHYGHDIYGCIELKPVFAAPLIEGKPDAFFTITGRGNGTDQSVFDNHKLSIVGLKGTEVAVSEYLFIGNYYVPPHAIDEKNTYTYNYPAAGKDRLKDGMLNNQDGRGRKKYAKLFVADFDKNNKLELVFWHRQYQPTRTKEKKVGMVFEKEWFTAYEENNTADGFNKKTLTIQQGHTLLKEASLGWKQGYPKDNHLCTGRLKRLPMMPLIYDSDEIAY